MIPVPPYDNMVEGGRENKKIIYNNNNIDTKKKKNFVCLFVCVFEKGVNIY